MFVLKAANIVFYSAGKIGTQTLSSIPVDPSRVQLAPLMGMKVQEATTENLRRHASAQMKRMIVANCKAVAVIREPNSRFVSGIYEIIAKQVYGTAVEAHARITNDVDAVRSHISAFYSPKFWDLALDRCLRLRPRTWISDIELDCTRWQYHAGNWLADVVTVQEIAASLGKTVDIVDLPQLTGYLTQLGIEHTHANKRSNMMYRIAEISNEMAQLYATVDHNAIQTAFNTAYERIDHRTAAQFNNYLAPETELYLQLKSKSIVL